MQDDFVSDTATLSRKGCYIYIAGPWGPKGGGMYKVADYLIQAQAPCPSVGAAKLRHLDTRGGANAIYSMWVLAIALGRLVHGRMNGRLVGVHVNVAERLSLFRKGAVMIVCRALGIPVVLHLHAAQLHHFYRKLPRPLQAGTRWIFSLPSACVVLGSAAQRFVTHELRVPADRVSIVFNGVPEPVESRRAVAIGSTHNVLFLGNLSERKGVSDLLQALALPGFDRSRLEVALAGGGDVRNYEAKAKVLGIDGFVHFKGWLNQRDASRLMAQADVLVLPSYDEGLPLVILEALSNAVPVICSPVGEIPSVLTHDLNAIFVRPGDVVGLADSLKRVLQNPELTQTLGQNGRALFEQQFSITKFFASIAKIHKKCFGVAGESLLESDFQRKK